MRLLASEYQRLIGLRSTWIWIVMIMGSIGGPAFLRGVDILNGAYDDRVYNMGRLHSESILFMALMMAFVTISVAGDIKNHSQALSFLRIDNRQGWLLSKVLVDCILVLLIYAVAIALSILMLTVMGVEVTQDGWQVIVSIAPPQILFMCLLGACLGVIVRNSAVAIISILLWLVIVEPTVAYSQVEWLRSLGPYLPFHLVDTLALSYNMGGGLSEVPSILRCVVVCLCWLSVFVVGALVVNQHRDIKA